MTGHNVISKAMVNQGCGIIVDSGGLGDQLEIPKGVQVFDELFGQDMSTDFEKINIKVSDNIYLLIE